MISAIAFYFQVFFFCFFFLGLLTHSLLVYWLHGLFHVLICIMHSAFNLFVFPNSMFTPLLLLFFY